MKILTVEDDKLIREGISEYLSDTFYKWFRSVERN